MIPRSAFAALLALLLGGASLAGLARAFDWHKPVPPRRNSGPIVYEPTELHPDAPWAKMPILPGPAKGGRDRAGRRAS